MNKVNYRPVSSPFATRYRRMKLHHDRLAPTRAEKSGASVAPLLQDQDAIIPKDWPTGPKDVKSSYLSMIADAGFDILLVA